MRKDNNRKVTESSNPFSRREFLGVGAAALLAGCASPVPGTSSQLSGYRMRATLTYNDTLSGSYYYFLLINNRQTSSPNVNGPIPVGGPLPGTNYGNGFATGYVPGTSGFTDFVLYGQQLPIGQPQNNTALYHVINEATADIGNANYFDFRDIRQSGTVLSTSDPINSGNPVSGAQLVFEIDLGQLVVDPSTNLPFTSVSALKSGVEQMTWLQLNAISTNILPRDPQTAVNKQYDSMGNDNITQNYFLPVPVFLNGTFQTGSYPSTPSTEVTGDVQPPGSPQDPKLDLVSWNIELFVV